MRSTDDLHTKARIRNAAIDCFSRDGFDVGISQIAEMAGVSPGLVAHHFGSKAGLRAECDRHVLARVLGAKLETVGPQGPKAMLMELARGEERRPSAAAAGARPARRGARRAEGDSHVLTTMLDAKLEPAGPQGPKTRLMQLAKVEEYRPIAAYAVASLAAGGDLANALLDEMTRMTAEFLAAGEEAGTIRPSSDAHARARYLTLTGMGMLLLEYRRHSALHPDDPAGAFDAA